MPATRADDDAAFTPERADRAPLMTAPWWGATALVALHWAALLLDDAFLVAATKPLAMVGIIAAALVSGLLRRRWGAAAFIGLLFGLTGDVLLLWSGETAFLAGLLAFLCGHLAYLVAFRRHGLQQWWGNGVGLIAVVACVTFSGALLPTLWRDGGVASAGPVAAYMLVIGAMSIAAWATRRVAVGIGASLFVLSDTILAMNAFVWTDPAGPLSVMVPYLIGQGLIAWGLSRP